MARGAFAVTLPLGWLVVAAGVAVAAETTKTPADSLSTGAIRIRADIDGLSRLVIRGNTLHWFHASRAAPGRGEGGDFPTYVNGAPWYPEWPQPDRNRDANCSSSVYVDLVPPLPASAVDVGLLIHRARGNVRLAQQPYVQNGYTLIVDFDDRAPTASDWYDVTIAWPAGEIARALGPPNTVELQIGLIDVDLPADTSVSVDLSPEALGFAGAAVVSPHSVPVGLKCSITEAPAVRLDAVLQALKKQGNARLRASRRVFVAPGAGSLVEVEPRKVGDTKTVFRAEVMAVDSRTRSIWLKTSALAAWCRQLPSGEQSRYATPWGVGPRSDLMATFTLPAGHTAFWLLRRTPGPLGYAETVAFVTATIVGGDE